MKKKLIAWGILLLLITVGLSGCNEQKSTVNEINSEDSGEENYFTLFGNITNNYGEVVDIDFIVSAEYYTDWYFSTVDNDATIRLSPYEVKEYSCQVKKGFDKYYFMISWYYITGEQEQGDFSDINFTNPNFEDVIYHVEIKSNKELEISKTYHSPDPNNAPNVEVYADVTQGLPPLKVSFTGTATDEDGNITSYYWDFKDGSTSYDQSPTHTFQDSGTYNVKLIATDNKGATGTDSIIIKVESVGIINHNYYTYDDSVWIVGIVKNFGSSNVKEIEIKSTLYNNEDSVIGFDNEYAERAGEYHGILKPDETSGFIFWFSSVPDFDDYSVEINSYSQTSIQPYHDKLDLYNIYEESGEYFDYIKGIVRNLGAEDASGVTVYALLFDSDGKILDIEETHLGTVYAGKSESFSIMMLDEEYDSYEIQATCYESNWN